MSSIKSNPYCKFTGCTSYKKMGAGGYCWQHEDQDPGFARKSERAELKKLEPKIKMLSGGNSKSEYGAEENKLLKNEAARRLITLTEFFKEAAAEIHKDPRCWECKEKISVNDYRNATAHILPKGIFRSVETHPFCYVVAGPRCGCHDKTHRMDTFSRMNIFPLAVSRFRMFEHLITEKHKLLDEFLKYANLIIL